MNTDTKLYVYQFIKWGIVMKKMAKILASVVALVLVASLCVGCFGPEAAAKATVDKVFTTLKSTDTEKVKEFLGLDEGGANATMGGAEMFTDELLALIFENLEYEIIETEVIDDDNVNVTVKVTNTDMGPVFKDFVSEVTSYAIAHLDEISDMTDEETMNLTIELLTKCLEKDDLATKTEEIVMHVYREDGVWDIDPAQDVIDAILGGFIEASQSMN